VQSYKNLSDCNSRNILQLLAGIRYCLIVRKAFIFILLSLFAWTVRWIAFWCPYTDPRRALYCSEFAHSSLQRIHLALRCVTFLSMNFVPDVSSKIGEIKTHTWDNCWHTGRHLVLWEHDEKCYWVHFEFFVFCSQTWWIWK